MIVYGITIAGLIGLSQYFVLKRKDLNAKLWLIVTFSGWIFAWLLSMLPYTILPVETWHQAGPMMDVLFGLTFGAMTALGLRSFVKSEKRVAG